EGNEMMKERAADAVKDAGLIATAQRVEHYEISGYGTVCTFAEMLGRRDDLSLLQQTLAEEKETDERLNRLAKQVVNPEALHANAGGSRPAQRGPAPRRSPPFPSDPAFLAMAAPYPRMGAPAPPISVPRAPSFINVGQA